MSKVIDGRCFQQMILEGAAAIEEKKQQANELNVFPVPDGDTGTNMSLTMGAAARELERLGDAPTLKQAVETTSSALLRGARGNSGVITSLLFRGMAKKLKEKEEADGVDLAVALREGVETAYKAVMKPTEGTILTVSRVSAQHAVELCQADSTLTCAQVLDAVIESAQQALAETQFQNPVLEKAGVVDAGAFGYIAILEGMRDALLGVKRERKAPQQTRAAADFAEIDEGDIKFTYCTEFIAERRDQSRNVDRMRSLFASIGDSIVVVEDDEIVKVHVHTNHPDRVLAEGLKYGPLITIKIENMRQQHSHKVMDQMAATATPAKREIAPPEKKYGFVSVAAGEGMAGIFADLGVDQVVQGGQIMNPSTDDILRAVDAVPAEIVFILPNNKNIIMAAEQTAPLSEKRVITLPTKNIPQGISAMLAFDPDGEEQDNEQAMREAAGHVRAGQVTYAARNSDFDGRKIKEGEYLALYEGKLTSNTRKMDDAVRKLVREMTRKPASFATVIYGQGVTEEEAERIGSA